MKLHLGLSGSRLEQWFVLSCHLLAIVSLGLSAMSFWLTFPAGVGLAVSAGVAWRRARLPRLAQILFREDGWTLVGPGQQVWKGKLLPSTRLGRWLTLLHFRLDNGRFLAIPVWCDSLAQDDYRRLQLVLRWVAQV